MSLIDRIARQVKFGAIPINDCWDGGGSCNNSGAGGGYFGGRYGYFDIGGNDYFFAGYNGGNTPIRDTGISNVPVRMTTCNCLHGTAYQDATGACLCCDGVVINGQCTGGIKATPTTTAPPSQAPIDPTTTAIDNPQGLNLNSLIDLVKANPLPFALGALGLVVVMSGSRK